MCPDRILRFRKGNYLVLAPGRPQKLGGAVISEADVRTCARIRDNLGSTCGPSRCGLGSFSGETQEWGILGAFGTRLFTSVIRAVIGRQLFDNVNLEGGYFTRMSAFFLTVLLSGNIAGWVSLRTRTLRLSMSSRCAYSKAMFHPHTLKAVRSRARLFLFSLVTLDTTAPIQTAKSG